MRLFGSQRMNYNPSVGRVSTEKMGYKIKTHTNRGLYEWKKVENEMKKFMIVKRFRLCYYIIYNKIDL